MYDALTQTWFSLDLKSSSFTVPLLFELPQQFPQETLRAHQASDGQNLLGWLQNPLARLVVGQRIWTTNLVLKSSNLTHSTMPSNDLVLMHNETLKTNVKENLWQQVTRINLLSLRLTGSISVLWYSFPWVWQEATQQFSSRLEQSCCRTQVMEQ